LLQIPLLNSSRPRQADAYPQRRSASARHSKPFRNLVRYLVCTYFGKNNWSRSGGYS